MEKKRGTNEKPRSWCTVCGFWNVTESKLVLFARDWPIIERQAVGPGTVILSKKWANHKDSELVSQRNILREVS